MKTILVIDDEAYFGITIKATLDAKKYKIVTAPNGEEGLKTIEEQKPDAILLDMNMPVMDGLEVLKRLQAMHNKIPVLISSNLSSRDVVSEGITLGARGYIIKSNESPQTIADTIEDLFVEKKKV